MYAGVIVFPQEHNLVGAWRPACLTTESSYVSVNGSTLTCIPVF